MVAAMAEYERELIRERTIAGLAAARKRGRIGGRPRALPPEEADHARRLASDGESPAAIARLLGCSRSTIRRVLAG